jgi:hypothetical protein
MWSRRLLWKVTGLDALNFKEFVATGATGDEVDHWIRENTTQKDPAAIIKWNNEMRCVRLCDLSQQVQEYFETYIPQFCHPPSESQHHDTAAGPDKHLG